MTDLIYDALTMGVDMIISSVILSSIVMLLSSTQQLNSIQAMQTANADMMNYYREYNQFDNTDVNSSDVLGCILYYRGTLEVMINGYDNYERLYLDKDGKIWFWSDYRDTSTKVEATDEKVRSFISVNRFYNAKLVEDRFGLFSEIVAGSHYQGGVITGIIFNQHDRDFLFNTPTPIPTASTTPSRSVLNKSGDTELPFVLMAGLEVYNV